MNKFKKVLRLFCLVILIALACCGIGITGSYLPTYRERYQDNEIKIEQIDKKRNEDDDESNEMKA